jgi:hypothetical protein
VLAASLNVLVGFAECAGFLDPVTWIGVTVTLIAVTAMANAVPRRAAGGIIQVRLKAGGHDRRRAT